MTPIRADAELLTQVQVCARLGISDEAWRRWRRAGRTPDAIVLPSGRLKWRVSDIDRMTGKGRPESPIGTGRFFQSVYKRRRA